MKRQTYEIYQDLPNYENQTHYIYAAVETTRAFFKRPFSDIIAEIRQALKDGKSKFMFLATEEALLLLSISKIHRLLAVLGDEVDASQFYYLTSSIDGERAYNNYCKRVNYTGRQISIRSAHAFERKAQFGLRNIDINSDVEPNIVKEKLFLCFNKVNREHRMWLLDRMLSENLVDSGFYSFEGIPGWVDTIPNSYFPNIRKHRDKFPLRLNITEDRTNPVDIIQDDIHYHKNSYFSIVTETIYFDNNHPALWHKANVEDSIFFTEKTYRCFALKHPFILLGRPGSLVELRKSGYKTFYPFISEDYDKIVDNVERFEFIVNEIKRLCSFTKEEWDVWSTGIKEIVDYNHNHFFNRKTYDAQNISK
jgi:hypothetical protein